MLNSANSSSQTTSKLPDILKKLLITFLIFLPFLYHVFYVEPLQRNFEQKIDEYEEANREEYYRGIYDMCKRAQMPTKFCLEDVSIFEAFKWYEHSSDGWEWPINVTSEPEGNQG